MNFSFHNQLNIYTSKNTHTFYNTLLPNILNKLSRFENYNQYLSIGNGLVSENVYGNNKLTNHIYTTKLKNYAFQSDISKGVLFAKYEFCAMKSNISGNYITEIGLSNDEDNPTIYNYFSLITSENPYGINVSNSEEIVFEVLIYLNIDEQNEIIFTAGPNPFFEYLLGNGLGDVFLSTGSNYAENIRMHRLIKDNVSLFPCDKECFIENNSIEINFNTSLSIGEIDEVIFITDSKVFARKNLKEINSTIVTQENFSSSPNYVIKINADIKNIQSLTNSTTGLLESNYHISKYANSFGDKMFLPFNNIFTNQSSRFISKDGKNIFFIINDKVYAYKNENFSLNEINSNKISDENIINLISFDKYVFIISKTTPYIETYIIENNVIKKIENNFNNLEVSTEFEGIKQVDVTWCNNNKFLIGIITKNDNALTIYFDYIDDKFVSNNYIINDKKFNYVIAMYKNSFCDGQMIYLKEGETSASCRIVTHQADSSETDVYSYLAYALTNNATKVYSKGRALIAEKKTSPLLTIYYYPQMYEYNFPLSNNEEINYISTNLNYIIQKLPGNQFKTYNLIGYDNPEEFVTNISSLTNDKILDFEFLNDSLLMFVENENEPVIGFNLNLNKTQIENVSQNNSLYQATFEKYDKLGKNNENINIKLSTRITI